MTTPLLDDEDLANIEEAIRMADEQEINLRRAEDAGLEVAPLRARLSDTKARLTKIRGAFFPNR